MKKQVGMNPESQTRLSGSIYRMCYTNLIACIS